MRFWLLVAVAVMTAGCAYPVRHVKTVTTFDVDQARALIQKGTNTIKGSALIRQNGGGVVTCAGTEVELLPKTAYATERITTIYGNADKGYNSYSNSRGAVEFNNTPDEYGKLERKTLCDAQGYFKFENVADGPFFVIVKIVWRIDIYPEGGYLMQRVDVSGGETKEIVLAP